MDLLPVGAMVRVVERGPNARTYIGKVVGYDIGRTKYHIGARYGGWGRWLYADGGCWAFLSWVKPFSEPFEFGERLYHRGRREHVIYVGVDEADPSGATVWVKLPDGDEVMVSTHLLDRPAEN